MTRSYYSRFVLLFAACYLGACASPPPLGKPPILPNPDSQVERAVSFVPGIGPRLYGNCTRVLSIDGGGIRGIIPAMVLAKIEERTGKPISKMFDIVVGTSTGGIIALGLTKPNPNSENIPAYSAHDIVELYKEHGSEIFPSDFAVFRNVWRMYRPKYDADGIDKVFKKYFGDVEFYKALVYVSIPAYEIETRKHFFFKSWDFLNSGYFLMRDVARAATAAPTYLPPVRIPVPKEVDERGYLALIDGGVFANNPAIYALNTAATSDSGNILFVSLGTGSVSKPIRFDDAWGWGLLGWTDELISIVFSDPGVEKEVENILTFNPNKYDYFRFQPILQKELSKMDDAGQDHIKSLENLGEELIKSKEKDLNRIIHLLSLPRPPGCNRL